MFTEFNENLPVLIWRAAWQAAVLFSLVWLIVRLNKSWIPARYRVLLWTIPMARLLLLVLPVSGLSLYQATAPLAAMVSQASSAAERETSFVASNPLDPMQAFGAEHSGAEFDQTTTLTASTPDIAAAAAPSNLREDQSKAGWSWSWS